MDVFTRLEQAIHRENAEGELPDFIVPLLLRVVENRDEFAGREDLVKELAERVEDYDNISNYCCEKLGFNLNDIHITLDRLRVSY